MTVKPVNVNLGLYGGWKAANPNSCTCIWASVSAFVRQIVFACFLLKSWLLVHYLQTEFKYIYYQLLKLY